MKTKVLATVGLAVGMSLLVGSSVSSATRYETEAKGGVFFERDVWAGIQVPTDYIFPGENYDPNTVYDGQPIVLELVRGKATYLATGSKEHIARTISMVNSMEACNKKSVKDRSWTWHEMQGACVSEGDIGSLSEAGGLLVYLGVKKKLDLEGRAYDVRACEFVIYNYTNYDFVMEEYAPYVPTDLAPYIVMCALHQKTKPTRDWVIDYQYFDTTAMIAPAMYNAFIYDAAVVAYSKYVRQNCVVKKYGKGKKKPFYCKR